MATVDVVVDAYRLVLKREPDPKGLAYWMEWYNNSVKDVGEEKSKSLLVESFKGSEEYKTNFGGN
jgi:hypothetical protein